MRLIDADAAKKAVHEEFDECLVWDESGEHTANVIEEILEALPTVDAVPVIRCKDCKYNPEKAMSYLDDDLIERYIHCGHLGDEGYCSLAKKKE